jgi:hypothetical protein
MDDYGYTGYRADCRHDVMFINGILRYVFDPNDDITRLQQFARDAQPFVDAAIKYLDDEERAHAQYERTESERVEREIREHSARVARDAGNLSRLAEFIGDERDRRIVIDIPRDDDGFWVGKIGTCISTHDVSPNGIRDGSEPQYSILDHTDPIPGNSNRNITRYFGWRGTTNDSYLSAHGVRMVEKIVRFQNHSRVYLSKYHPDYVD